MSDARTDFFASGAKASKPTTTRDDFFAGNVSLDDADTKPIISAKAGASATHGKGYLDAEAIRKGSFNPIAGVGETALQAGTGAVSSAAAGIAGGLNALWNASPAALIAHHFGLPEANSADLVRSIQGAGTYQPRTESGQEVSGAVASQGNPLNWPGAAGQFLGDKAEEAGAPAEISTLLRAAPDAAAMLVGARETRAVRPSELSSLPTTAKSGFERESLGAAAAAQDLAKVSPTLRSSLEQAAAEGPLNREIVTRHIEADSLPIPMRLTKGQATQDPSLLSKEQNLRGTDTRFANDFKLQNQQLIDNLDEIRGSAAPNVVHADPVQSGQALIDAYKQFDEPIRADITAKYKALEEANGGQFPVDGKSFVEAADAALAKKLKGRYVPSQVAGDLEDLRNGGAMTFEQFENLRTNLAAEARKADRSGDGNAAAAVNIVRESLETLPMSGEAANIKPLADAARSAAKARFDRLRDDPAYRAAADDDTPIGELSPLADNFIDKHVVKGKAAHLKTMQENLSADPIAKETIAAGALNYLKQKAGVNAYSNDGNFSQAGYNRALAELMPKLKFLMPEQLAEQTQALGNVARYTQAQPRGSFVNNSNTFVAAAAEKALPVLEGVLNVHAGGLPVGTFARKKIEARSARKFYEESTAPAAGVKLNSVLNAGKKK